MVQKNFGLTVWPFWPVVAAQIVGSWGRPDLLASRFDPFTTRTVRNVRVLPICELMAE